MGKPIVGHRVSEHSGAGGARVRRVRDRPLCSITVPCESGLIDTAVTVRVWLDSKGGPGTSFESKSDASSASGVPSSVLAASAPATGGSFSAATVIVTVAGAEAASPSLAVKVNESGPK